MSVTTIFGNWLNIKLGYAVYQLFAGPYERVEMILFLTDK
jgi:hypothetical protein